MEYTIGKKIGSGSFGTVHEAVDAYGSRCAVKVVRADDELGADLLRDQFELLSSVHHSRILRALDFDSCGGSGARLVTELVDGEDLAAYVARRGTGDLVEITARILDGLRCLHGAGWVHGDLKPDSILVQEYAGRAEVKLIDAGLDYGKGSSLPTLVGTLPYLAPEVTRSMPTDGRSDLYSLGVVLYEMLTGTCPFGGSTTEEILGKHLEHIPDVPSSLVPGIDGAWDEFISVLISKEPFHRYKDAVHAGLELQRLLGPPGVFFDNMILPDCAPLIGRRQEIGKLIELLAPPGGRCVLVCGERGSGIRRILRKIADTGRLECLETHMVELDPVTPALAQVIDAVIGRTSSRSELGTDVGDCRQGVSDYLGEVIDTLRSSLSLKRKHLLIIERGEVMDAAELLMFGALAREFGDLVRICVGYRVEYGGRQDPVGAGMCDVVELGPLDSESSEEIMRYYLGAGVIPADLAEEVYFTTHGNPGRIDLTLRDLWNSGSIKPVAGDGVIRIEWDKNIALPTSVRDSMRAKVKALGPGALVAARSIVAIGGRIDKAVLDAVSADGESHPAVAELSDKGLVTETEDRQGIEFRWDSLTDVIREMTPQDAMKEMSLKLASIVEAGPEKDRDDFKLGLLYLEAARPDIAYEYLVRSGDLFAGLSPRDAVLAYEKALLCAPSEDAGVDLYEKIGDLRLARDDLGGAVSCFEKAAESRPSSRRKHGWVLALQGKVSESIDILQRCRDAASADGDDLEYGRVLTDLGYVYSMNSQKELALESLEEARAIFERAGLSLEAARSAGRIGTVELRSGRFKAALRAYDSARRGFEHAGDRRRAAACLTTIGLCYWKQMDIEHAEASFTDALSTLTELKVLYEKAICCQNYALLLLDQGKLARARVLAEEARNVYGLLGMASETVTSTVLLSAVSLESGNWVEAADSLEALLKGQGAINTFQRAMIRRYQAEAYAMSGDFQKAMSAAEDSYNLACEADDADGQGQAMLEKSKIFLRFAHHRDAVRIARNAMTALGLSSSLLRANEARRVMGEALCHLGETERAISELIQVLDGFAEVPESLHHARTLRSLALAYYLDSDHESFAKYLSQALDLFRSAGSRFDYADTLLLGGREAIGRGNLLQAGHYLMEARRIFESLDVDDLRQKAVDEMERIPSGDLEVRAITSLSKISQSLSSSRDLTTVLNLAMDLAIEYLGAERGAIMLEDEPTGELITFVERKMDTESLAEVIAISKSIVESVRLTGQSVIASDATKDPRFMESKSVRIHNVMSVVCVPLTVGDRFLGIIYLDSRGVPSAFTNLEKAFVDAFANQVSLAIMNAKFFGRLYDDFVDLRARAAQRYSFENIIGPGKKMQEVFRQVEKVAKSDITVMLTGKTGTGKELIAGLIHEMSDRKDKPLVKVNCAALPRDLLESELFGIEKRVATGVSPRSGFFERADGGTVLLDEVGDMPPDTQGKVLRALAEQEFERVGGSKVLKLNVRVISATNQNLRQLIEEGRFRNDLYYRLNDMRIHLPPLADRPEDMAALVRAFVEKYADQNSKPRMEVSEEVLDAFKAYGWPGNVRELETCIHHAVVFAEGTRIEKRHLRKEILEALMAPKKPTLISASGTCSLFEATRQVERDLILEALDETDWVKTEAAARLGIHESTLRKKIKLLGIQRRPDAPTGP